MTKVDISKACEMRTNGATYEEIGSYFGVSKQYVYQIMKEHGFTKTRKSVYPGIDGWLFKNDMTWGTFAPLAFGVRHSNTIYKIRNGSQRLHLNQIKSILDFTGMTFEEAFGEITNTEVTL